MKYKNHNQGNTPMHLHLWALCAGQTIKVMFYGPKLRIESVHAKGEHGNSMQKEY